MARKETITYSQAKDVFDTASLKADILIDMPQKNASIFRKHLSEMIKRKGANIGFTSRYLLDKNQLLVIRIK